MKKLLLFLFLFSAGIAFSQTEPLQEEDPLQELSIIEDETGFLSDIEEENETGLLSDIEEENTDELTQADEEQEESPEDTLASEDTAPAPEIVKRQPFWITEQDKTVTRESPQWSKDLRRAEIITFGAFPIMVFFSRLFIDIYLTATHNWDNSYAPWPFTGPNSVSLTTDEVKLMFGIAALASVIVSVSDHFIIRHKRKKAALKASLPSTSKAKPEIPEDITNEDITDQIIDEALQDNYELDNYDIDNDELDTDDIDNEDIDDGV